MSRDFLGRVLDRVSIPFIAGQWSLRTRVSTSKPKKTDVSIPFIAGQWSLREGDPFARQPRLPQVSIPFIAEQWSLPHVPRG